MFWIQMLLLLILPRVAIAQIREGDDWYASLSIFGIAMGVANMASIMSA